MSSGHQQHFTIADIALLDRILQRAGMEDVSDPISQESRLKAARFLIETFQSGMTDEGALHFALVNRPSSLTSDRGHASKLPEYRPIRR